MARNNLLPCPNCRGPCWFDESQKSFVCDDGSCKYYGLGIAVAGSGTYEDAKALWNSINQGDIKQIDKLVTRTDYDY